MLTLLFHTFCLNPAVHRLFGSRMFCPARLTTALVDDGRPDTFNSSCSESQGKRDYSFNQNALNAISSGTLLPTQPIFEGPGILDTLITLYPLCRRSLPRAVPIKPVPPPGNIKPQNIDDKNDRHILTVSLPHPCFLTGGSKHPSDNILIQIIWL